MVAKSKPEILKHGGNGGKDRGHGGILKNDIVGRYLREWQCFSICPDTLKSSSVPSGFLLRSLRVSGFLVLTLHFALDAASFIVPPQGSAWRRSGRRPKIAAGAGPLANRESEPARWRMRAILRQCG